METRPLWAYQHIPPWDGSVLPQAITPAQTASAIASSSKSLSPRGQRTMSMIQAVDAVMNKQRLERQKGDGALAQGSQENTQNSES
jgi:hypothetical protein